MAKQRFKGALAAASFPLVSILQPRTVVNPQLDLNVRTPRNPNDPAAQTDYSIPQVLYCENVMPTAEGMQSVSFVEQLPGIGVNDFDQMIVLRDNNETNYLFSPAGGNSKIFDAGFSTGWAPITPVPGSAGKLITRAHVNGRSFICYEGLGIYEYNNTTHSFDKLVLSGIADYDVRGIGNSSNYLLAFTDLTVHWSSLVDPLDFVPSLTTGAGFAIPQDVKAKITAVLGIAGGYIVYTLKNAVAAVYTNNTRAPFTFKEVSNAGGVSNYEQVSSEQNSGPHYAWTTGGLQKISIQGAEPVSGEVSDFLAGRLYEIYDPVTHQLTQYISSASDFPVKLAYISSRWLVISYSITGSSTEYDYALVYDIVLRRWGKLKFKHVDCFSYPYFIGGTSSKLAMAFLEKSGRVSLLGMNYAKSVKQQGVIIFGKFQLVRGAMMTLQQVDFEGVYNPEATGAGSKSTALVQANLDGYTTKPAVPLVLLKSSYKSAKYAKRVTGLNFNLIVEGNFALTSYIMEVTLDGDR